MANSLVRRVALGAALAASAAALVAALATIVLTTLLLQRAEDRRLEEAAVTFGAELGPDGSDLATVRAAHRDESEEMDHTGMHFTVYDAQGGLVVGERRLGLPREAGCSTTNASALRVCRAQAGNGLTVVVGAAHTPLGGLLAAAALLAALFAAALAWATSLPISRLVVAPLTRLRERIAQLDIDALSTADLGAEEQIAEVDALRRTIEQLVVRVERALSQAHRFAANAAHELRTPLTTVRAELELLAEGITEPGARTGAAVAQQKLVELSMLVERLLILSVPKRSAADAHEVVSLRDLLEDVVHALSPDDRSRVQLSEGDALVRGDAALLSTLAANAIANGLKFGTTVTTEVLLTGGTTLLRVDDDGPGIDAAERERVFEPFFRSAEALRRRVPGHGLGLALIRHIAETHGGRAALVDKPTRGARLEIHLPTADSGVGQAAKAREPYEPSGR